MPVAAASFEEFAIFGEPSDKSRKIILSITSFQQLKPRIAMEHTSPKLAI